MYHRWFFDRDCWIQPTSGLICAGPYALSANLKSMERLYISCDQAEGLTIIPPLGFTLYGSDHEIIKHIEDHFDSVVSFVATLLGNEYGVDLCADDFSHLFTFGSVMAVSGKLYDVSQILPCFQSLPLIFAALAIETREAYCPNTSQF
jgi:hypothetical protein